MKKFIVLCLLSFAFMLGIAAPEPPDKTAVQTVQKSDLVTSFIGFPTPEKVTEPTAFTANFRSLRLTWFLWKEQLRANEHENLSHNQAKYLGFNRGKETNIWDFTDDLKTKSTANKTLFETPDFMWQDSKRFSCK